MTNLELLVERALHAFDQLDDFGKGITLHAARARSREELGAHWLKCNEWELEHVIVEELEYEVRCLRESSAEGSAKP